MKRIIILVAGLALAACSHENFQNALLDSDQPRISYKGDMTFAFDEKSMQLAYLPEDCEFRMLTDNMSDFLRVVLSKLPEQAGEKLTATRIEWSSQNDIIVKKNAAFEVLKTEGGTIWMYDQRDDIGLVLRVLE